MKKMKQHYIRIILRPLRALKLSLIYFYGRVALSLALRGIKVPGLNKIKNKMPKGALGAYERRVLIYEIKGERYSYRKGPLWFRVAYTAITYFLSKNKFWLLIVFKTTIAVLVIAIPILIFVLIRGVLPVPERVSYIPINTKLNETSQNRTDWLYTEAPFNKDDNKTSFNYIDPENARGVIITPVIESSAPAGLIHFGIGYYPKKLNLLRGFLTSNNAPLAVSRNRNIPIEVENGNKLRIQYYLFPQNKNSITQCKIQLKDQNGNILASTIETTPLQLKPRVAKSLSAAWNERFLPNTIPNYGKIGEFIINVKAAPQKIIANVTNLNENLEIINKEISLNSKTEAIKEYLLNHPQKKGIDVTQDPCIFALGDFSLERIVVSPPKRRGIVFILVDTLRADTAYNSALMPNLNDFAKSQGIQFMEHRAQGNMTVPSIIPLMTSKYSREIGSVAFTYAADAKMRKNFYDKKHPLLATYMQNLGYRVGAIGWLSLFSETMQGGVDLGFHNAIVSETPEYEARQITEQMGSWLENYGDSPFFLYLHYNTTHGPYKPPLEEVDLKKFLSKPFGLNQKKQFYDGTARYWDKEFLSIIQKLKDLGIYDEVDIIITSDHGAQLDRQPWNYFLGVPQNIDGGYADKGSSLFDEEVRVPLIIKLADNFKGIGESISIPTAHIDLFPTLYNLAGGKSVSKQWRGIDLFPALEKKSSLTFLDILKDRNSIYFDGHRYAGILYWGGEFNQKPMKYVRQLAPDKIKLYLTHNPWSQQISWYQPEIFSNVNFSNHTEDIIPMTQNNNLKELRKAYFEKSPSDKIIRLTAKFSGTFNFSTKLKKIGNNLPKISLVPTNIKYTEQENKDIIRFNFHGEIQPDESIWINLGDSSLEEINISDDIIPVACPNGNRIDKEFLVDTLQNNICSFFAPPDGIIERNYTNKDHVIIFQKSLSNEQVEQIEGTGAGAALQNALREWGYAK
ncbi:sulfatase [Fluviispira multicolorata]|uniref:Sulfatase-like hydrolase/transferase n=1 Tax=Fluviispira multicolorata TaxID=2654512 RepID=A0A833JEV7_9BACT|nr:sulfatase [Fluviispira multicolorata]KAB8030700.1 sulfatase-like hydrolase/transferase [Fluviispira multicolorata]